MLIVDIVAGLLVAYGLGAVLSAYVYSNFWEATNYRGHLEENFIFCSLGWPIALPIMLVIVPIAFISTLQPGHIQQTASKLISSIKKRLERKIPKQPEFHDSLEEKFKMLEVREKYK